MFTEEHEMFRELVRRFVEEEINPYVDAWEKAGEFPAHALFRKAAALGLFGLEYDPAYGGQGVDHGFTVVLGEELGAADAHGVAMAIMVHTDMATPSLAKLGSPELKERYLAPAIRGDMVAAIAVTEADAGSDVAGIRTRAVRDGDHWIINGSKIFITNGVQADWLCLLARTSDEGGYRGMSQIIVPMDTPGVTVSRKLEKLGNWSSDTAELAFTDVRVPVCNTVGEIGRGFQQQMRQFQQERLVSQYMAVGSATKALKRTIEYLKQRHTFGRPLIENQHLRFTLAELIAEVDMLRHYNYAAAAAHMRGEDVSRFATVGKLKAGRLLRRVADACLQYHGGFGYMEEAWTARFFRDSRLISIGGGSDEMMLRILSRMEGME